MDLATIAETGAGPADFDGLTALPRQVEGVEIGVTLREREPGFFKVSVRTSSYVDASALAARLGGGGHIRAAGCTVRGTADEAVETIHQLAKEFLH